MRRLVDDLGFAAVAIAGLVIGIALIPIFGWLDLAAACVRHLRRRTAR